MINICFFSGDITRSGGAERVATVVANGLSSIKKYRVSILSLVEQKEEPFYFIMPTVKRFVLRKDRRWISPGTGYLQFVPTLRRFLITQKIDIIIDVDLVLDVLVFPASFGMIVKVISWEHFHYLYERKIRYRRVITWLSVHFSDCIVTLTERDRQNYISIAHRTRKIVSICNPINMPGNIFASKEKILITVGRLSYEKGIDMLAQIIPLILGKHKDWKWYFLGDGEYSIELERVRSSYKLEDRLILTGEIKNVEEYLERSSIMVMGSREEGLGMCLLEARACRVPCIAFDIPVGPLELIAHGVNGFLISPFNLSDMAEKIMQLIENNDLRERFMNNTVLGLERFQMDTVLKKWTCLIDSISDC